MTSLMIAALGAADGRDSVSVGAVRHGRRADPDRRAADPDAAADGDGAACDHADGLERLARFLWRAHIRWRPVFVYLIGCALALGVWSITRYVPDKPIALLLLGVTPFMARLMPKNIKPNPDSIAQGSFYGFICMGLMLMTGVSGPLMDTFFLGSNFGRREVVATKATCQVASHFTKLIYFGGIIDQASTLDPVLAAVAVAASMLGTTLARRILEAMSDAQFRTWANRLITTVAGYYILYGSWLLFTRTSAMAF